MEAPATATTHEKSEPTPDPQALLAIEALRAQRLNAMQLFINEPLERQAAIEAQYPTA
jgi:hypothetical protein